MQIKSDLGEDLRWKINGKKIRNNGGYYNQHFHKKIVKGNYTRREFWINTADILSIRDMFDFSIL